MLRSKGSMNIKTKQAEEKEIEDLISSAASQMKYEIYKLNLTDYQREIIEKEGYKLTHTKTREGHVWVINWE